jgi:hypothetical protein
MRAAAVRMAICGVRDEVAHVSMTSVSPRNTLLPQAAHGPRGWSTVGSTGSSSRPASLGSLHASQYQTGKGTPK